MKSKIKVLLLKPEATCIVKNGDYEIWYDGKRQNWQRIESWAWAEAFRDLFFQYSSTSL